jgi:antitoxin component of MazEF toxin-antitoxin module
MVKKLSRHGNSLAMVIDQSVLDLLKADADTSFDISTDGRVLILAPVQGAKRAKQFDKALAQANKKYGQMLKNLAG